MPASHSKKRKLVECTNIVISVQNLYNTNTDIVNSTEADTDTVGNDENLCVAEKIESKENIDHTPPPTLSLINKTTVPLRFTQR